MAINDNNKGPSLPSLSALALTAALSGVVEAKSSPSIDTARLEVQEQVGKTIIETRTGIKLEALLSQTEPVLLAGAEGVKGIYDFSRLERLGAYKNMSEVEQGKIRKMYDLLVESAKGDLKKEEGVKQVILSFVMFIKSVSYNPGNTIDKSERYLNETISDLRKYGFGEEFVQGLEKSRQVAQERDKYSMYLSSLSEKELLEKIEQMKKDIAENEKKTAENEKKTAENMKKIEDLKRILKNLEQVKDAMSKKVG